MDPLYRAEQDGGSQCEVLKVIANSVVNKGDTTKERHTAFLTSCMHGMGYRGCWAEVGARLGLAGPPCHSIRFGHR